MVRAVATAMLLFVLGAGAYAHAREDRAAQAPRTHVVQPGQTLGMIAKRYRISIDALCTANGIRRGDPIRPKQTLRIPHKDDKDGTEARDYRPGKPEDKPTQNAAIKKPARSESKKKTARETYAKAPKKRGYVIINGPSGSWRGIAVGRDGKVTAKGRDGFERVLSSWRTGKRERIHGRLIRMLVKVSDHFGGRPIRVVSGFRPFTSTQYTPHSRHNLGRAVDFSVSGVPNEAVRDFCRTLYNVGVGYYPNSSFVHLDVRDMRTYWIDYSGPGQAPRYAHEGNRDPAKTAPTPQPAAADGSGSTPDQPAGI
jgi:uncharacterized protein YcbK (DUF882 family)